MRENIISAFKVRTYRIFALGNAVSMLGVWIQKVAAGWLAWDLSHSTVWLGLVAAADLIPAVLLSSVFGALADRHDKVRLLRGAQLAAMLEALAVAALVFTGLITVEVLFVLTLLLGVANSVDQPSRLSLLREILPPAHIPAAVTFNSISFSVARFAGPMLAGLTIAAANIGFTFLLTAVALGGFLIGLMTLPVGAPRSSAERPRLLGGVVEGFGYLKRHPVLRRAMMMTTLFGVTVGGVNQLLPALAGRVFERGVGGFVEMTVSAGLGAFAAGLLVFALPARRGPLLGQPLCFAIAAAALGVLALTSSYALGVVSLFFGAFAATQSSIHVQSTINREAREESLGRVMGVYGALVRGAPALGGFGIGSFASMMPFSPLIGACAVAMGGFCLWLLLGRKTGGSRGGFR